MKITIFQALVLLAKKYSGRADILKQIKPLLLSGIQNAAQQYLLDKLLKDEFLQNYTISYNAEDINNDPTRRYFESQLCFETINRSLSSLDEKLLKANFDSMFGYLPAPIRLFISQIVFQKRFISIGSRLVDNAQEFAEEIQKIREGATKLISPRLSKKESEDLRDALTKVNSGIEKEKYTSEIEKIAIALITIGSSSLIKDVINSLKKPHGDLLRKEINKKEQEKEINRKKLLLLMKCTYSAITASNYSNDELPINIYINPLPTSPFFPSIRGRQLRKDESGLEQDVKTNVLGNMRSYMPVSANDSLYADNLFHYVKPADKRTYVPNAEFSEEIFATKVNPFVNSISGVMLSNCRLIAKLEQQGKFIYKKNPEQLKLYFKLLISILLYQNGGHSLYEFFAALNLPEVQSTLQTIPGFSELTLNQLFIDENSEAFNTALTKTFSYNNHIKIKEQTHSFIITNPRQRLKEKAAQINKAYNVFVVEQGVNKDKTRSELIKYLHIHSRDLEIEEIDTQIKSRMTERAELVKIALFSSDYGTAAERLDRAWELYQDSSNSILEREIAQSFLTYVLDIDCPVKELNEHLIKLMSEREQYKTINPEFIPGKTLYSVPQDIIPQLKRTIVSGKTGFEEIDKAISNKDILDNSPIGKKKDRGGIHRSIRFYSARPTQFLNARERAKKQVFIHKGQFMQNNEPFDASNYRSHQKNGFAAFTINLNGELSIFNLTEAVTSGTAHSAPNAGLPVAAAGELRIKDGKLLSISYHSGHYKPYVYNIYKTLEYFKKHGVDISNVEVFTLTDISHLYPMVCTKSKFDSRYYVTRAEDLFNIYKAGLRKEIFTIKEKLIKYKSKGLMNAIYSFKDFLSKSDLTKERRKLVESLELDLSTIEKDISKLNNIDTLIESISKLKTSLNTLLTENRKLNAYYQKNEKNGRLNDLITKYNDQVTTFDAFAKDRKEKISRNLLTEELALTPHHNLLKKVRR